MTHDGPVLDPELLSQWVGNTERVSDTITLGPAQRMAATLGLSAGFGAGDALPALWHWSYFLTAKPRDELGRDGHPKMGGFLPPVALPRRMWAGGRFSFVQPLRLGDKAEKTSKIEAINVKKGRTGALCFVTVSHEVSVAGQLCLREEHDIVFREDPKPGSVQAPQPAPYNPTFQRNITPDPVLLFRYSALTFNGHRIHYDRDYCQQVEGYPDLVVHGPLIATMLAGVAQDQNPDNQLVGFSFRAHSPVFVGQTFSLAGNPAAGHTALWVAKPDGNLAMTATASFDT